MQDGKLYLVFEFMYMDLKKYFESLPGEEMMEPSLVKVCAQGAGRRW